MDVVSLQDAMEYIAGFTREVPDHEPLEEIIPDVSARMAQFCGRDDWGPRVERTEYHDGGMSFVLARVWPVVSVSQLRDNADHDWTASDEIDDYHIADRAPGVIFLDGGRTTDGRESIELVYTGGYAPEGDPNSIREQAPPIRRAALIQIYHDYERLSPKGMTQQPGWSGTRNSEVAGLGLLDEVRALLRRYARRSFFP